MDEDKRERVLLMVMAIPLSFVLAVLSHWVFIALGANSPGDILVDRFRPQPKPEEMLSWGPHWILPKILIDVMLWYGFLVAGYWLSRLWRSK